MDGIRRRVAFVAPSPRARGGIAQFSAHQADALGSSREVLYLSFRRLYPRWTRAGRGVGRDLSTSTRSSTPAFETSPVLVPWLPWTWMRAAGHIAEFRPDLLIFQWWHPALGPCLAYLARRARRAGIPVAFICHNCRPHEGMPLWRTLTRRALRHSDALFALSRSVAEELEQVVRGGAVHVVHHPPNLEPALSRQELERGENRWIARIGPVDGPVILFFGYVRPYKGLQDLIDAMPGIRARVPATLVVAGPFLEPPKRFLRQAEALGVAEHVRLFPGYVPNEEVESLFATADVLALPYRSATQSGVVPLAATFGVPVVATAAGGIPEAIGERGVIVPPNDSPALADGLVRALREPPPPPATASEDWGTWAHEIVAITPSVPEGAERRRTGLVRAAQILMFALVAYFVGSVLVGGIADLRGTHLSFDLGSLVASCVLLVVARVTDVACWSALLRGAGASVRVSTAARIFTTAELVRFLPAGPLHLAARYRFASKVGVSPLVIVTTTAVDLVLRIVGALVLFVASIPFWPAVSRFTDWLPVAAIPVFVILLHPKILGWMVSRVSRFLGRSWTPVRLPFAYMAEAGALTAIGWILRGAAAYLVTRSLVDIPLADLMPVAGAFSLSWALGVLTPFVPGGIGVREAAAASLMSRFMSLSGALVVVVVARVQSIVIELGTTAVAVAWDRRAERRRSTREVTAPTLRSSDIKPVASEVGE